MLGITFGSKHSYTDWGVFLENTEISPPLPKRYLVDVPARNGQLDLTAELTPTIRYQQRTLKYTFRVKAGDWDDLISQIYGDVHGKTMNVVSDLDLSWHWHGCVTVDSFASNKRTGVLVISVDCDPFKLANTENEYTVTGNGSVTAVVDRMEVSPAFEITAPTTVQYDGNSYALYSSKTKNETKSGDVVTFADGTDNPATAMTVDIEAVQGGSGDPSPSNIRQIWGWQEAQIHINNKNFYIVGPPRTETVGPITFTIDADGGIHASGTTTSQAFRNLRNVSGSVPTRYFPVGVPLKIVLDKTTSMIFAVCYQLKDGSTVNVGTRYQQGAGNSFTIPEDAYLVWPRIYFSQNSSFNDSDVVHAMVVRADETDYSFETYQQNLYSISFSSAGAVYGGTLDVLSGVLTVTHTILTASNGTNPTYGVSSSVPYLILYLPYSGSEMNAPTICSSYLQILNTTTGTSGHYHFYANRAVIYDSRFTDKDQALGLLTTEDFKLVYPLATPQTYTLSAQQVATFTGKNNIWANCGDSVIKYQAQDYANMKLYLPELELPEGNNTLTIQSTGNTKITYTNGRL